MTLFSAFLLGIIQGLTEFIPVSSSAHMLIGQQFLNLPAGEAMFSFLVLVQLGTLVALIVYFWKDLLKLSKAFFAKPFSSVENRLAWFLLIATLPALLAGYFLKDAVEELFRQPMLEAGLRLLLTAIFLSLAEGLSKRNRALEKMTWLDALFVGAMQVFSVFPGASRSGTTISGGMWRGLDRSSAARFAFLMSVPVMLAAGAYQTLDVIHTPELSAFFAPLEVGFITAALVGWLAIKWLLEFLKKRSLYIFAIYCAVSGLLTLGFYYLRTFG